MELLEGIVKIEDLKRRTNSFKKLKLDFYTFTGESEGYFVEKIDHRYKIIGSWRYLGE